MNLSDLPILGAALEGGLFAGVTTTKEGMHCAVVLLADKPERLLAWKKAKAWAEGLDATLPTRPVAALLYANAKDQFETDPSWHWTCEEEDGSYAWNLYFDFGNQFNYHERYEGRARAVRLIQLSA